MNSNETLTTQKPLYILPNLTPQALSKVGNEECNRLLEPRVNFAVHSKALNAAVTEAEFDDLQRKFPLVASELGYLLGEIHLPPAVPTHLTMSVQRIVNQDGKVAEASPASICDVHLPRFANVPETNNLLSYISQNCKDPKRCFALQLIFNWFNDPDKCLGV